MIDTKTPLVSAPEDTSASVTPSASGYTPIFASKTTVNTKPWLNWAVQLLQKSMPDSMREALIESLQQKATEEAAGAKHEAVKRLRMVLLHDRTNLSPGTLDSIRSDILTVISKYIEVDQETLDLHLEQEDNRIALVANIAMLREREPSLTKETVTKSETSPLEQAIEDRQDELMEDLLQSDDDLTALEAS